MNYQIISDSSCDLPLNIVHEKNLVVVPFYISFDEEHYKKEMVEIGIRDFYEEMVANPKVFQKLHCPPHRIMQMPLNPLQKRAHPSFVSVSAPNSAAPCNLP